jgi:hypothetical protein
MKLAFKRFICVIIVLLICLTAAFGNASYAEPLKQKNCGITIFLQEDTFDNFTRWIQPFTTNFHNFTFIISQNYDYTWFLNNQTKRQQLSDIGEAIPGVGPLQTFQPSERITFLEYLISQWQLYTGAKPQGIFMFQPDTVSLNYLRLQGINYVVGYCFDQYEIDWMTMRGGWQLPYYASSISALMPENASERGVLVYPWLTWDWVDSFTLDHVYDTHPFDVTGTRVENKTDYVLRLINDTLNNAEPLGYAAFSFEFGWIDSLGLLNQTGQILQGILDADYGKMALGNLTVWFRNQYQTTPTYAMNFTSPNSGTSIEWLYELAGRVARVNDSIVSYVNYSRQTSDPYLTEYAPINFSKPNASPNVIDNSLTFTIDALGGGKNRAPIRDSATVYDGNLADFLSPNPEPTEKPTLTPTQTPAPTPTPTERPSPTTTPTSTPSPTQTPTPTEIPSPSAAEQPTATPSATPTTIFTPEPTATPTIPEFNNTILLASFAVFTFCLIGFKKRKNHTP